jgi:hypothetical protein
MNDIDKIPFKDRIVHAWNIFRNKDPSYQYWDQGMGTAGSRAPNNRRLSRGAEKSIVTAVYNRIAVDAASLVYKHVQLDEQNRYMEDIDSKLNRCLTIEANLDQTGRAFIEDLVLTMLDYGNVAIVPTVTTDDPFDHEAFDIDEMRTATIKEWFPQQVRIEIYNDVTGQKTEYNVPKRTTGIIENPFFPVMNEANSTAQRLMHKLALLDSIDDRQGADRLDLLIQFPQVIKTDMQRRLANKRLEDLEAQLRSSNLGIGYIDGSEHVVQLNRAVENQLKEQISELTSTLLGQLGMTMEILNGTADAKTMNNYFNQTIEPIASAITDEMTRKFLTRNAITRKKAIRFFRDPFKLLPITDTAEIADKFTRNEIMTSNEIRQKIGMMPSDDPRADELRNANISESKDQQENAMNIYGEPIGNNTGGFNQNER